MKKNNKGFTLVEIIAVVTILGILITVAMPKLIDLVTDSRDEMYVQDARKLIAQAQYVLSSKSDEVEKPVVGDYIVLSLNYLGTDGFSSPPNGGTYLPESSFVVVKNIQDSHSTSNVEKFKYSVVLVEEAKDGFFRGIKLRTEEELADEGAKTLVDYFNSDELVYVDDDAAERAGCTTLETCVVNNQYINDRSSDEEMKPENADGDNFTGRYNYLITQVTNDDPVIYAAPVIDVKALSSSTNMQMLELNLSVTAQDADSNLTSLKVCYNVSKNANGDYPSFDDPNCEPYKALGDTTYNPYVKAVNLADYGFTYEDRDRAYFYVSVYDPERNYARKRVFYEIHKNTPPEITEFTVSRLTNDVHNMANTTLTVGVKDDMDKFSELQACISDSDTDNNKKCTDYKPLIELFPNGYSTLYTLRNSSGKSITIPDGSVHYLYLYVKDTNGEVSSQKVTLGSNVEINEKKPDAYVIYKNQKPNLTLDVTTYDMQIDGVNYTKKGKRLNVDLSIKVTDDLSSSDNIKIEIDGYPAMTFKQYEQSTQYQSYVFGGTYDGEDRTLNVTVTDQYGEKVTETFVLKNVYKNEAPQILDFSITPTGSLSNITYDFDVNYNKVTLNGKPDGCVKGDEVSCFKLSSSSCNTSKCISGNYNVIVSANIVDDFSSGSKLMACLSEDKDGCKNDSDYSSAANFRQKTYTFKTPSVEPFANNIKKKTLYLFVKDEYGSTDSTNLTHEIYKNVDPEFVKKDTDGNKISTAPEVNSNGASLNTSNVTVYYKNTVTDDFNDYKIIYCYIVKDKDYKGAKPKADGDNKDAICQFFDKNSSLTLNYLDDEGNPLDYDSQHVYSYFIVRDGYGGIDYSDVAEYVLSANVAPIIRYFSVVSSKTEYNSIVFDAHFTIDDPDDIVTACITTTANPGYCDDPSHYYSTGSDGKVFDGNPINLSGEGDHVIKNINGKDFKWSLGNDEPWKYTFDVSKSFGDSTAETLMLVVKDSKGLSNSATAEENKDKFRYIPRYSCGIYDNKNGDNNPEIEITNSRYENVSKEDAEKVVIEGDDRDKYAGDSTVIQRDNPDTEVGGKITTLSYDKNTIDDISAVSCNGLCYVFSGISAFSSNAIPNTNLLNAFYKKSVTYYDKLVRPENEKFGFKEEACNETIYSKGDCQRASCFDASQGDKSVVNNNLIGLRLYETDKVWTTSIKNKMYHIDSAVCKQYANENKFVFTEDDKRVKDYVNSIISDESISKICNNYCLENTDAYDADSCKKSCDLKSEEFTSECSNQCEIEYNEYKSGIDAEIAEYNELYTQYLQDKEKYEKDLVDYDKAKADYEKEHDEYIAAWNLYQEELEKYTIEEQNYTKELHDYSLAKLAYDQELAGYNDDKAIYEQKLKEYNDAKAEYEQELKEYNDAKAEYEQKLKEYNDAKAAYDQDLEEYNNAKAAYDQALEEYNAAKALYEEQLAEYEAALREYEEKRNNLEEGEELPPFDKEMPTFNREKPTFNREKPTFNMEKPTFDMEKPTFDREEPTFNRTEPKFDKEPPTFDLIEPVFSMVEPIPPVEPIKVEEIPKEEYMANCNSKCISEQNTSCLASCKDNNCIEPCQNSFNLYVKTPNEEYREENKMSKDEDFYCDSSKFSSYCDKRYRSAYVRSEDVNSCFNELNDLNANFESSCKNILSDTYCSDKWENFKADAQIEYETSYKEEHGEDADVPSASNEELKKIAVKICNDQKDNDKIGEVFVCKREKEIVDNMTVECKEKENLEIEEAVSNCLNKKENECISEMEKYRKIPHNYEKVSCDKPHDLTRYCNATETNCDKPKCSSSDEDCKAVCYKKTDSVIKASCSENDVFERYCESDFLGGLCSNQNCTKGSSNCNKTCYKKVDCNTGVDINYNYVCHGYFKVYRSVISGSKVILNDTGMRMCPELLSSSEFEKRYAFDENSKTPFIKFVQGNFGGK